MTALRIGYDLFAGSSQAGTDDSTPGNVQVETNQNVKYKLQVQRLSDDNYYNVVTPGWQAGVPTEAQDLDIPGSEGSGGPVPAIRRLMIKLPKEVLDGIDSDGCVLNAYPSGGTAAGDGVELTLAYKPVT